MQSEISSAAKSLEGVRVFTVTFRFEITGCLIYMETQWIMSSLHKESVCGCLNRISQCYLFDFFVSVRYDRTDSFLHYCHTQGRLKLSLRCNHDGDKVWKFSWNLIAEREKKMYHSFVVIVCFYFTYTILYFTLQKSSHVLHSCYDWLEKLNLNSVVL